MKKTFALSLILVFLELSLWAEGMANDSKSTVSVSLEKAVDDNVAVIIEDVPYDINVVSNDIAPAYDHIEVTVSPIFGTLQSNPSGFVYTPDDNYYSIYYTVPIDSFQYTLVFSDATNNQSAWVYIDSIRGVNDIPIANRDSFMVVQDSGAIYATVLENDIDGDKVGLQVRKLTDAQHGKVTFHKNVFKTDNGAFVFFPNEGTPFNSNLDLTFNGRDMTYLADTVFVYEPELDFYGYDSISYAINEYRMSPMLPIPSFPKRYEYANTTDADTATIIFYVEPHNYSPVAVNDTMYKSPSLLMQESDVRVTKSFFPMENDLDGDTVPSDPSILLELPYILSNKVDSASATADNDTVVFYHNIAQYDSNANSVVHIQDSNIAYINSTGMLSYSYAPGYSGVDSLFYCVVEKNLLTSNYPNRFRGDTSALGIIYFVVEPINDVPYTLPDTLDYDFRSIEELKNKKYRQYFDVLSNDKDIDEIDEGTINALKRLLGTAYKSEYESYGNVSVRAKSHLTSGLLQTIKDPSPGEVRIYNDSVFYYYKPLYLNESIIDSFRYSVYNGDESDTSAWAFIRKQPLVANNDTIAVSMPFIEDEADSTIASNLLLTANDVSSDTLILSYNMDGTLNTPSKSSYAAILKPESGEANYYYHQGFVEKDSFQYVVRDMITNDTAWVFMTNAPCVANDDSVIVQQNPFDFTSGSMDSYVEEFDVLPNDNDPEDIKFIMPYSSSNDTLDTGNALVTVIETEDGAKLKYQYKTAFFYQDSFAYVMTDVPVFFAASGFFTQDSAMVYVTDTAFFIDSDGDGIVNTMEDGISGYQLGEDTIDSDDDGLPNYLDADADGDGFRDGGDCDGDGILNFLDDDPGCDDIEVATVFTPNGDGKNDLFVIPEIILGNGVVMQATIKIYNRLGSLVYENMNYGQNEDWWDGKLGNVNSLKLGEELPNGVYLYYMTYNNGQFKKKGYVHIQR